MIPIRFLTQILRTWYIFISQIWTEAQHPVLNLVESATSDFFVFCPKVWQIYLDPLLYVASETKIRIGSIHEVSQKFECLSILINDCGGMPYLFYYFVVVQHVFSNMPSQRFVWLLSRSPLSCPTLSVLLIPRHRITFLDIPCVRIWRHRAYYYKEHLKEINQCLQGCLITLNYLIIWCGAVVFFYQHGKIKWQSASFKSKDLEIPN